MPQLAIDRAFMPQYARLDGKVRRGVEAAIKKFSEHAHAGLHLEKLARARDPRVRTIRIDRYWRGVVLAPESGDIYCLLTVLGHNEAIAYACSRLFSVNQVIGVIEVRDQEKLEKVGHALEQASQRTDERLFEEFSDKVLTSLGIDAGILPIVRLLVTEQHLLSLEPLLPEPQYIALLALTQGMTVEQAWAEVTSCAAAESPPAEIDTEDLVEAMRRTPGQVRFVDGLDDLAFLLSHPFDVWRAFLHPLQQRVAYRNSHSGPVQVTGGAGTGKTVTALHRARFLVERSPMARVLLTTFTRNLADTLAKQLELLIEDETARRRITVLNIDRVSHRIVAARRSPRIARPEAVRALFEKAAERTPYSAPFLEREWDQVIVAQEIDSEESYLRCSRSGRGSALNRAQRTVVWAAISLVTEALAEAGEQNHRQLAVEAEKLAGAMDRYDHVIVDEAQDMHPAQWRLLRALVEPGPDDLFVVGDPHQRIYGRSVSLGALGISVRGRSHRLKLNYRTTQEILSWVVPLLGRTPAAGLDGGDDTLDGYRSPMHGRRPHVQRFTSREEELTGLVHLVSRWLKSGIEPHAIGVAARYNQLARDAIAVLNAAGIKAHGVESESSVVKVDTMHKMKGLEFRCVAVIGVDEGSVPALAAITNAAEDPLCHEQDLQRERCLLYVACTRARDHLQVSYTQTPSPFLPTER